MNEKGIAVAGNMIVDILYPIKGFPKPGELTTIVGDSSRATGGCLCNDIINLAALDGSLHLTALGRIGNDDAGDFIMNRLQDLPNVDLEQIKREGVTSYTLVMADEVTKQRSFYQCRGANALFCEEDIDWDKLDVDLMHIGYILLLDALDEPDEAYGTKMARLLHTAQKRGIKTSIDVVTEAGERFRRVVAPALKFADYCIINEAEAQATTGIPLLTDDGTLLRENMPAALHKMKEMGVSTWAVIHCPEGGFGLDEKNRYFEVPGLKLPEGYIKGSVGAGDAFCSGVLYGAWKGMPLISAIELGTAAAACSLSQPGATEGMRSYEETMQLYRELR
ncbi:MAG: carbohydrate kinase family protein [Oscillospiraceae bacterium]|nr:carbohydrate kinase family protein [Oscillospiraceae bacterium]